MSTSSDEPVGGPSKSDDDGDLSYMFDERASRNIVHLLQTYGARDVAFLCEAIKDAVEEVTGTGAGDPFLLGPRDHYTDSYGDRPADPEIVWDRLSNEVASRLGDRLVGIEPLLDLELSDHGFRQSLADWFESQEARDARSSVSAEMAMVAEVITALAHLHFPAARAALEDLTADFPERARTLRKELPLVLDDPEKRGDQDIPVLLWRLLDLRSPFSVRAPQSTHEVAFAGDSGGDSQASEEEKEPEVAEDESEDDSGDRPEEKGRRLEEAVMALLAHVFDLDEVAPRFRRQGGGSQFGFDVAFRAAAAGSSATCVVECKNYKDHITLDAVAPKVVEAAASWDEDAIDHWILISPRANADNRLDRVVEHWAYTDKYPFNVQLWTPATGVHDLFRLSADAYEGIYGRPPKPLSDSERAAVIARFARRLRPPLRVPPAFRDLVGSPTAFLYPRDNKREWPGLLKNRIQKKGVTETRAPLSRPLVETLVDWLGASAGASESVLILAEFGEGKSFFTYELTRTLLDEFSRDPDEGTFPVRMLLRDYRNVNSPSAFIATQLEQFGANVRDFHALKTKASVAVILDGIDEMSVRLDGETMEQNLEKLQDLLEYLNDVPVVLTSRPHFFESPRTRELFYDRLRRPRVYRLAPSTRRETAAHLEDFALSTQAMHKLQRIKQLYDPIGLAGKVLFLDLIKATLRDLREDHFSEVLLYKTYVENALRRKLSYLQRGGSSLEQRELIEALLTLLEDIAVEAHQNPTGVVDLRVFAAGRPMSKLLWKLAEDPEAPTADTDEDAAARIGMRSLLRKVTLEGDDAWEVDFFHRSLKEYFVARAIVHALAGGDPFGRPRHLLMRLGLQPEIARFVGQVAVDEALDLSDELKALTRSAGIDVDSGFLGGNAITLLHACGISLASNSWPRLRLDAAGLEGAVLAGCDFRGSSLRWANLDNADLSQADLRDTDLTGVRLDETSEVLDLAADGEGNLVALYADSNLRLWNVHASGSTSSKILLSDVPEGFDSIIFADDGFWILTGSRGVSIWASPSDGEGPSWHELARFPHMNRIRRVAVPERGVLAVALEDEGGKWSVVTARLDTAEVLWAAPALPETIMAAADGLVVFQDPAGDVSAHHSRDGRLEAGIALAIARPSAIALASASAGFVYAIGTETGGLYYFASSAEREGPSERPLLHQSPVASMTWFGAGIASAGVGRTVLVTRELDGEVVTVAELARQLRCKGALVHGLEGARERTKLVAAGAIDAIEGKP